MYYIDENGMIQFVDRDAKYNAGVNSDRLF